MFHRILQYLINIDRLEEHLSASSTCGERKRGEAREDCLGGFCLLASDAADRLSAGQRKR